MHFRRKPVRAAGAEMLDLSYEELLGRVWETADERRTLETLRVAVQIRAARDAFKVTRRLVYATWALVGATIVFIFVTN
jgi:hypothetical protein